MSWYEKWFDSEYYHILYDHRSDKEAESFLNNLCSFVDLPKSSKVLDLACGKGRHSKHLASKGFDVVGIDLSTSSISQASEFSGEQLRFYVHDMRMPFEKDKFKAVFSLFTSFGYFQKQEEDSQVLNSVFNSLRNNGVFILDFLNIVQVKKNLIPHEVIVKKEIEFIINRSIKNGFVTKNIQINTESGPVFFEEKVRSYTQSDIENLVCDEGFVIQSIFGDYELSAFDQNSPRLIIYAIKP